MPVLGDFLAAARDRASQVEALLVSADPSLAVALRERATKEGMPPSRFARAAVADFSRFASEEDWVTLLSSMRDSEDPGAVCLAAMVHWRLTAQLCSEHSSGEKLAENCDG